MSKNLVIVESPAKAKTIEGYLGENYKVKSCYGQIRDLPKTGLSIDVDNGFTPTYEISEDKKNVVKELLLLSQKAECVYLASDDDREGESISYHLKIALNLTDDKIKRIVFREITKKAILSAIESPRKIDLNLVDSQQARRILDRIVGYYLSPVLWKKIRRGLSAGRVQSVAVRLVAEREREISEFKSHSSFFVDAEFNLGKKKSLKAELLERLKTKDDAIGFLKKCISAEYSIGGLERKPAHRSPSAPFTTSTLQQEASRKLGCSVTKTMLLAQRLYENGKISYMRTDSVNLSNDAIESAKNFIATNYGNQYFKSRIYKNKIANAQQAHEAIRPTDFSVQKASTDSAEQRLYNLIWKRAIASQMSDAQIEKTTATIDISTTKEKLIATGEVVLFDGFMKVYGTNESDEDSGDEYEEGALPPLKLGQKLTLDCLKARERFSKPPARYTEASLVKNLEERGIGRPSTYAPTISTIQKRGYVIKEDREGTEKKYLLITLKDDHLENEYQVEIVGSEKQKLFPTDIAMVVNDFLVTNFSEVTDYDFTAKVEEKLDEIAQGNKVWNTMLTEFYEDFYPKVKSTTQLDRVIVNSVRLIGTDPSTGKVITAKLGKYGPFVQIGENNTEELPKFASLKPTQRLETITLLEALDLFKLPREIGAFEEEILLVSSGRFGPYIKHGGKFYSLGKQDDALTVTMERAIELIQAKRNADANKIIKQFETNPKLQILNGRWGAYLKYGEKNFKIPKSIQNIDKLTEKECLQIVNDTANNPIKSSKKGV